MPRIRTSIASALLGLTLSLFAGHAAQAQLAQCDAGHCSAVNTMVNEFCKQNGDAGRKIPTQTENGAWCYCGCSCVAAGTMTWAYSPELKSFDEYPSYLPGLADVEYLLRKQALYTPVARFTPIEKVMRNGDSAGTKLLKITFADKRQIIVSPNHTFITPEETIISAAELRKRSRLLTGPRGEVVRVASIERIYDNHKLYNVILNEPSMFPEDHVWFTNGLWSGDWMMQTANDLLETEIQLRSGTLAPAFIEPRERSGEYE